MMMGDDEDDDHPWQADYHRAERAYARSLAKMIMKMRRP